MVRLVDVRYFVRTWEPRYFIALVVFLIVVSRGTVILTSHDDLQIDLSIYQEVGELIVNGIDPYDFASNESRRQALRLNDYGATANNAQYDYYVTANLPASSALYGLIEFAANGNAKVWRLALALGDIATALAASFFLGRAGVVLDTLGKQTAFSLAVIYYPSTIYWGLVLAEDKQYQTALMLLLAGLLLAQPKSRTPASAIAIGAIGCLSVTFKAFGVFLAPLALQYFKRAPRRDLVLAICAAVIGLLPILLFFDASFIRLMFDRVASGLASTNTAFHGSPWQLVPLSFVAYARPVVSTALILAAVAAYLKGKIDLLNLCAAVCLIAACLWVVGGSMDRMNIAMMFAMFCTATISVKYWQTLALFNFIVQLFIYAAVIARTRWLDFYDGETPDAIATAVFVTSYFLALLRPLRAVIPGVAKTYLGDRAERRMSALGTESISPGEASASDSKIAN